MPATKSTKRVASKRPAKKAVAVTYKRPAWSARALFIVHRGWLVIDVFRDRNPKDAAATAKRRAARLEYALAGCKVTKDKDAEARLLESALFMWARREAEAA